MRRWRSVALPWLALAACSEDANPIYFGQFGGRTSGGVNVGVGPTGGIGNAAGGAGNATGGARPVGNTGGANAGGSGASPAAAGGAGCPRYCGPTFDELFDNQKLATIRIHFDAATLADASWLDLLWQKHDPCPPHSNYVPVRMQYESPDGKGNVTLHDVGMRLRGSMVRDYNELAGFKLDFQVLAGAPSPAGKRRFGDLNRLNTLSVESNPSHMLQCLGYKMLRDFGLPAPRCNHLKVYVNDQYYGLMEHAEQADNRGFLRRHFGDSSGHLYAASPSSASCGWKDSLAKLEYGGDTFTGPYTLAYQLVRATAADAEKNLIPMMKCGDATATPDDAAFKACISEWLDVDEWLKQIAAESLMPTLESFIGFQRNYFLYFKPDQAAPHGGRFVVWSWDLDHGFQRQKCAPSDCNVMTAVSNIYRGTRPKLVTRLLAVFKAEYCAAMSRFLDTVYLPSQVDDMAAVVRPGIEGDPSVTPAAWQVEVTALRNHVAEHSTRMRAAVATACN
jgi:hypothetical protein